MQACDWQMCGGCNSCYIVMSPVNTLGGAAGLSQNKGALVMKRPMAAADAVVCNVSSRIIGTFVYKLFDILKLRGIHNARMLVGKYE